MFSAVLLVCICVQLEYDLIFQTCPCEPLQTTRKNWQRLCLIVNVTAVSLWPHSTTCCVSITPLFSLLLLRAIVMGHNSETGNQKLKMSDRYADEVLTRQGNAEAAEFAMIFI